LIAITPRRSDPGVDVRDVTLEFEGLRALSGVSLSVAEGALTALVGPNGAGKTSLLNCVGGFYTPTSGSIEFQGQPIHGLSPHRTAPRSAASRARSSSWSSSAT
jgi:branched-chain amino acid transport system ATP-binding protein